MGVFIAISSTKPIKGEDWIENKLSRLIQNLNIQFSQETIFIDEKHNNLLIHFARNSNVLSSQDQTHVSMNGEVKTGVTVIQGYLWNKDYRFDSKPLTAMDVKGLLKNNDIEKIRDTCNGEYSVLNIDEKGVVYAFNDRLSVENIYYAKESGMVIISNRVRLITQILESWKHDVESMIWLSLIGYIIGDETTIKEIKKIPQASSIIVTHGEMQLIENPLFMYDNDVKRVIEDNLDGFIDQSIQHCMTNIQTSINLSPNSPFPLSGGKDSRAVLALLYKMGYTRKLNAYTNGHDEHPDVIVARKIAKEFKINHIINKPTPPQELNEKDILLKLMGHVFQTDGMLGAWDARGYWSPGNNLVFAGHIGEVYRGYNHRGTDLKSINGAAKLFHNMGLFDPIGILHEDIRKIFEKKLEDRISYYLDNGANLDDIPELIYTVERIPNWVGCLRRNDGYSNSIINPLNTENFIKLAFSLGHKQREIERIHFEIINRSNTFLAELPFANDKWSDDLKPYTNGSKLSKTVIPVPKGMPTFGSWQHFINNSQTFRNSIIEILLSFPESEVWNYFNKGILLKFLEEKRMSYVQLISIYGFITLFFKMHSIEVPMKILLPVSERNLGNKLSLPVKSLDTKTIYVYDGTKKFEKMETWSDFTKTGLSNEPPYNISNVALRKVT